MVEFWDLRYGVYVEAADNEIAALDESASAGKGEWAMEFVGDGVQYRFSDRYEAVFLAFRHNGQLLFVFEPDTPDGEA